MSKELDEAAEAYYKEYDSVSYPSDTKEAIQSRAPSGPRNKERSSPCI